ncbi:hypothetical protein BJ138DRAFT_141100 [Hygrophoropsis aurantiaca]|uniref:Uncharacterized protein n=1 Tax=Hygrophoropsis aurantiaca TaxID=72124 RepID=A0ACB8A9K4_9AGAM|nr:hypothetical protein BJ138DRAFT_141100 [Hygrophoropsis aurantiaca]
MALLSHKDLLEALGLPSDLQDEDITDVLSTLISTAAHDPTPQKGLDAIYSAVSQYDGISYLDPLSVLPVLISCDRDGTRELIQIIGQDCSAKEVVIAIQEALEQLKFALESESDENDSERPVQQVINVISLSSLSFPKLKLGKRTAYTIIAPVLSDLQFCVGSLGRSASKDQGRGLIYGTASLAKSLYSWVAVSGLPADIEQTKDLLVRLIDATIFACASSIQSFLAARLFEARFPRLVISSSIESGWQEGEQSVSNVLDVLLELGVPSNTIPERPSLNTLIYLAHSTSLSHPPIPLLSTLLPFIVASIQMNVALDECLFLLLDTLLRAQSLVPRTDLLPDIVTNLAAVLPPLASTHPDPFVRHLTLRLVSLLLNLSPQPLRLEILMELTSEPDFPQMRSAAIGLLKEAVLEGLSAPIVSNVFASKMLLQAFGAVLFKTIPPDFFSTVHSVEDIQESLEPGRISECLSLYYVLLQRDKDNKTGIRGKDSIVSVEGSLLSSLRQFLERWMQATDIAEPLMPLVSLQMGVDRVDETIRTIHNI